MKAARYVILVPFAKYHITHKAACLPASLAASNSSLLACLLLAGFCCVCLSFLHVTPYVPVILKGAIQYTKQYTVQYAEHSTQYSAAHSSQHNPQHSTQRSTQNTAQSSAQYIAQI